VKPFLAGIGLTAAVLASQVAADVPASAAANTGSSPRVDPPRLLSQTGLYAAGGGTLAIDRANRPYSPQYPLWTDGARKSRWVRLPDGATIDVGDIDRWDFPVGTRFWKEFAFGGRRSRPVSCARTPRRGGPLPVTSGTMRRPMRNWRPADGLPNAAELAPGKFHSIPSVEECRACHDSARTDILGFSALQLSTDRDPNTPNVEPLRGGMVTLRTLVDEGRLAPARPDLVSAPPRIATRDARTRAVLGYLSANCGSCHNPDSSIAHLGLDLRARVAPSHAAASHDSGEAAVTRLFRRTSKWKIPHAPAGASRFVTPGTPELSAVLVRMRSRRPSSQMPPIGTVLHDREAIDLVTAWILAMRTSH
jgi:hypothetical protein